MPPLAPPHSCTRSVAAAGKAGALILALAFALSGCRSGLFSEKNYLTRPISEEELRQIDSIDLTQQSRSKPETVDEAGARIITEVVAPATAPATIELTIEEVRAAALANNLDLKVEVLNPQIAQTTVDAEEAKFDSTFVASARRSVTDSPAVLGTESSQSTFDSYNLGVEIPLRTGGTATIDLPLSRQETNNPFALLNPAFTSDLQFSISQPLLRNAGVNVNTHSIRVAEYEKTIVDAQTKLEAIRILADAERAYWTLYAARRELQVRQEQYELAVRQLERAKRRVQAGDAAQIEVTRSESGVADTLQGIIIAAGAIQRQQRNLKRIMQRDDLPLNGPTEIVIATDPAPVSYDLDGDALAEFAVANRMEMLEEELRIAIAASTIDFTRNQKLPLVTLDYTYRINGLGSSFGRSFDQIPPHSFEDWSLGLSAQMPIGNDFAKAQYHGAVLQRLQRLATRAQREAAIRQEVYDALDFLREDWQRILAARQATILATRTFEAEQRQFDVGLRTSTDVLDAATNLADAQSQEVFALTDYQISQIDIAFATGTLLGRGRVRLDEESDTFVEEPPEGDAGESAAGP
jgi:outer membrane protein